VLTKRLAFVRRRSFLLHDSACVCVHDEVFGILADVGEQPRLSYFCAVLRPIPRENDRECGGATIVDRTLYLAALLGRLRFGTADAPSIFVASWESSLRTSSPLNRSIYFPSGEYSSLYFNVRR